MILLVLIIVAFLLVLATWKTFPSLYTDTTIASLSTRLMLGIALVVCGMGNLTFFFSGSVAAWIVLSLLSAIAFFELAVGADKRRKLGEGSYYSLAFLIGLSILHGVFCLWPALIIGDLVPLEGTGNHDEFYYIFRAAHLINNSFTSPFSANILNPLAFSVKDTFTTLPRAGSEFLIVFLSVIGGISPEASYTILSALFSILLVNSGVIGLENKGISNARLYTIGAVIISLSPVLLHVNGNMNFASMLGLVFLMGYYWFLLQAILVTNTFSYGVVAGIFLAALITTYPELLTVALPASAIVIATFLFLQQTSLQVALKTLFIILVASIIFAPIYIYKMLETLFTISNAVKGANVINSDFFSSDPILTFLRIVFSTTQWLPQQHSIPIACVVLISFFAILLSGPRISLVKIIPLIIPSAIMLLYFWKINYGYGGMKTMQFLSIPLATLFASGVIRLSYFVLKREKNAE